MRTTIHTLSRIIFLGAAILLAACSTTPTQPAPHYRVVGYIAHFDQLDTIDVAKIDTLIFAFAQLKDGQVVLDADSAANLRKLVALKQRQPRLGIVVSVGGWTFDGFSDAASTETSRRRFADSAAQLLAANGADGLDVDWEYPGHSEGGVKSSPNDRENFTLLLQAVRRSLDAVGATHSRHYTLSVAIADGPFVDGVDIAAVNRSLDWFNLMTYDFNNSMTPTTGHHTGLHASALSPSDARTTDRAVAEFRAAGVATDKLLIGAAFYGREFGDVSAHHNGLYQPYKHYVDGHPWPVLKRDFIDRNGYVRYWDTEAQAPYLWNATTQRFITYDDPQSLAAKAAFVKANHLGGIMYWEQSNDSDGDLTEAIWQGLR
jgi:chitinase